MRTVRLIEHEYNEFKLIRLSLSSFINKLLKAYNFNTEKLAEDLYEYVIRVKESYKHSKLKITTISLCEPAEYMLHDVASRLGVSFNTIVNAIVLFGKENILKWDHDKKAFIALDGEYFNPFARS